VPLVDPANTEVAASDSGENEQQFAHLGRADRRRVNKAAPDKLNESLGGKTAVGVARGALSGERL
jgi:hypothetical protein